MKWNDEGILITKFHGEKNCIIKVLRKIMAYIQGWFKEGRQKIRSSLQLGAQLVVAWSARLAEHENFSS